MFKLPIFITGLILVAVPGLAQEVPNLVYQSPSPVVVSHIRFDFPGSSAIHLRENYTTPIPKPEWSALRQGPALLVQESAVEIMARFTAPTYVKSAFIRAEGGPMGGVKGEWVHFNNGVSDPEYYKFIVKDPAPEGIGYWTWYWQWSAATLMQSGDMTIGEMNLSGEHQVYTILDTPGMPWETATENNQNPWTAALELAFDYNITGTTAEEVLASATAFCFDTPCFKYDITSGAPYYNKNYTVNLTQLISDLRNGVPPRTGCCYDGGGIVHVFADLLGAHSHYVASGSPFTGGSFGYLTCIDPIGRGEDYCNSPFILSSYYRDDPICYQDGDSSSCGRSSFGNHAYVGSQAGASAIIWDGTMCADMDSNPDTTVLYPPAGGPKSTGLTDTELTYWDGNWVVDEWAGMMLNPNTDSKTPDPYVEYRIVANTAKKLIVQAGSKMLDHADPGDNFWIRDPDDPKVDIQRLDGYAWPDYKAKACDDTSNPQAPVERILSIK